MADQSSSPLLSLPAELRNAIWRYVLVHDLSRKYIPFDPFAANGHDPEPVSPAILATCQQVYREGAPILYGENTFMAHTSILAALPAFLLSKNPTRIVRPPVKRPRVLALIRRYYIHVRLDVDPRFTALHAQRSFTGIAELEIEVFQAMYGSCDFSVLRLFEGVRGVEKVVIKGSVGDG
ncbi:hypothetical protein LTR53_017360, partial [Teratosphaeriaceae sp. CCFEE 6253]